MKLSTRVVIGVVVATTAISVGFLISGKLVYDRTEREFLSLSAHSEQAAAWSMIRRSRETFKRHGRTIARERDAIAALVDGRNADLQENMVSTFNRIAATNDLSVLAIYDQSGNHAAGFPDAWTGPRSALIDSTLAEGTVSMGMTRLPNGRVGYGYALPMMKGRNRVGAAIMAIDIGTAVQAIAEAIEGDGALVLNGVASDGTEGAPPQQIAAAGLAAAGGSVALITDGDRKLVVVRVPLLGGAAGDADLMLYTDFTAQHAVIIERTMALVGGIVLATSLLVGAFLLWLRREIGPLSVMTGSLTALARGEPVDDVAVASRAEEISALGEALSVFVAQSARQRELLEDQRIAGEEAHARAEKAAALQAGVGEVMSLAASGDFSIRMTIDADDPSSVEIGEHVNRMLNATEHALERTDAVLHSLADADLTQQMDGEFNGCFADLQASVNATLARLRALIGKAQTASRTVNSVSERIREDAHALAARVESQSATLEQTAATTEEISNGVRSSSSALQDAESLASDVRQTTGEGAGRVGAAIEAVLRIQSESEGIQQIVAVIESIAFQTNLLALNAAVEAARAGEQGKGFAVVASEVRTLAQRTSEAAKDIKKKVSNSGGSVEDGVRYAEIAGKSLGEIEAKVDTLVARIQRCAETGRDQAGSIAEMNRAITHLDTIGQESSVVSDRNSVSAQNLAAEVAALDQLIGSFKMDGSAEAMREAS